MSNAQQEAYADSDSVTSDPFGIIARDNITHRFKATNIISRCNAVVGDPVLEVGCGHGLHAERYDEEYELTSVDLSPGLVTATRDRVPHASVMQMDATDLAFADNSYQSVVGSAILHHLPDMRAALREWLRVTKPGGSVTLVEPNYLFPLAMATTHLVPEERHKRQMAPWRVRRAIKDIDPVAYRHEPLVYTPPWPAALSEVYRQLDNVVSLVPGVRWASQLQLIHLEVSA